MMLDMTLEHRIEETNTFFVLHLAVYCIYICTELYESNSALFILPLPS